MNREPSILRGLLAGAAAGFVGSLAMTGFQEFVVQLSASPEKDEHGPHAPSAQVENTTETTVRNVARRFGHKLTTAEKQQAGHALHYGFGTLMGAVFGVAAEFLPWVSLGTGSAFGTALFIGTDEAVLPFLHLASQPGETPAIDHLLHWSSHVAYGTTMELTRRALVGSR